MRPSEIAIASATENCGSTVRIFQLKKIVSGGFVAAVTLAIEMHRKADAFSRYIINSAKLVYEIVRS